MPVISVGTVDDSNTIEGLLNKWAMMLEATKPSVEPLLLAALAIFVIFVAMCFFNVRALVRYLSIKEIGRRVSALAWAAWVLSIVSVWVGPVMFLATPVSFLMGIWAWLRLPADEAVSVEQMPLSYRRSVIPARMAVLNGFGITSQLAVLLVAVYYSFGSILRDIIWEFWEYKEMFRDYIVI